MRHTYFLSEAKVLFLLLDDSRYNLLHLLPALHISASLFSNQKTNISVENFEMESFVQI